MQAKLAERALELCELELCGGIRGIEDDSDALNPGHQFAKQLDLFAGQIERQVGNPGDVPAGAAEAADDARAYRVGNANEHDRNRRGSTLRRERGGRGPRQDDIDLALDKRGNDAGVLFERVLRPTMLDREIAALDIAEVAHAVAKCVDEVSGAHRPRSREKTDAPDFALLRRNAARQTKRGKGAGCDDQLPTIHWRSPKTNGLRGFALSHLRHLAELAAQIQRPRDADQRLERGAGADHRDVAVIQQPAEERLVDV